MAELLIPDSCRLCGGGLAIETSPVCQACRDDVVIEIPWSCDRCGAPVGPYVKTDSGCYHCRRERFAFASVIRLGVYEGRLRQLSLSGKQQFHDRILAGLTELLLEEQLPAFQETDVEIVVPLPQHWTQRFYRSHNAAETISRMIAARFALPHNPHVLARTRRTRPQKSLSRAERQRNVAGAFEVVHPEEVVKRTVLLVDDVLTTGSSVNEAARVLRRAGARQVFVAVIARRLAGPTPVLAGQNAINKIGETPQ